MFRKASLEIRLILLFSSLIILLILPCIYIISTQQLDFLEGFTLVILFFLPASFVFYRSFKYITDVLERVGLQLDSLGNEEYNSWHLAGFTGGRIKALKHDFLKLEQKLASKRQEYMHNESFLFEFIKDLSFPILVLDHHQQIYATNHTFNTLFKLPESDLYGKKIKSLGIQYHDNKWQQVSNSNLNHRYEINHHILKRSGRNYQLLMLFSVEQQLRDNEKQVWQRLIRVLNHEVRNSLTPIYSMTQSLQEMKMSGPLNSEQQNVEKNILEVIEKRSLQLLDFVENYSAFSKLAPAKLELTSSEDINKRIQAIFPDLIIANHTPYKLNLDPGQLEQALINVIKNAIEASKSTSKVTLNWSLNNQQITLEIIDNGPGIANPDNLFVPFYTTKEKGTGIGLILSREFIRNQGGELTLTNRNDKKGAIATISFTV